ncbi:hypothetical protein C6P45_000364 [Maudiozyma exigua]|uniref:Uncharacterized protein n=1 Tax=Maudiozyma exigua TaxID=34358 RepID=A0A9P6WEU2_MAUEX|nr:hypothetical protein C6P45_000364 [Kazachstania exigua]
MRCSRGIYPSVLRFMKIPALRKYATHSNPQKSRVEQPTSGPTSVDELKKQLWIMSNSKGTIENNQQLNEIIKQLSKSRFPANLNIKQVSHELYILMLQNRISNGEINKAIKDSMRDEIIVNVKVPKVPLTTKVHNTSNATHIPHDLEPQQNTGFDNIIRQIAEMDHSNSNELYQIVTNLIEESNEIQEFNSNATTNPKDVNQININVLENYINNVKTKQKQKKSLMEEQKKVYDWSNNVDSPMRYESRNLLQEMQPKSIFTGKLLHSSWRRILRFRYPPATDNHQYLFINLKTNTEAIRSSKESNNYLMHLQQSDLLNIINRASMTPDEVTKRLKELQTENWELLGNIMDAPEILIFSKQQESKATSPTYTLLLSIIPLIAIPLIYDKWQTTKIVNKKVDSKTE